MHGSLLSLHGTRLIVVLLVCVVTSCSASPRPLLPATIGSWSAERPAELFAGDQLYRYIDGAADVYLEYGFVQVVAGDYRQGDDRITLEVYTMTDSAAAYGISTHGGLFRGEAIGLGDEAILTDDTLRIRSGSDLVVVTSHRLAPARRQLRDLGEALAERFPASGSRPQLLAVLPAGQLPGSERYLRGPIALRDLSPRLPPLFPSFTEAVAARYPVPTTGEPAEERPTLLVVLAWPGETAAAQAMDAAIRSAAALPDADLVSPADDRFRLTFASGEELGAQRAADQIRLVVAPTRDQVEAVLDS